MTSCHGKIFRVYSVPRHGRIARANTTPTESKQHFLLKQKRRLKLNSKDERRKGILLS